MVEKSKNGDNQDRVQEFLHLHSKHQHRTYGLIMSLVADWNITDDIYSEQALIALRKCVKKLSDRAKELIKLRYENELTVVTISERIQQNIHTLYIKINRKYTGSFFSEEEGIYKYSKEIGPTGNKAVRMPCRILSCWVETPINLTKGARYV